MSINNSDKNSDKNSDRKLRVLIIGGGGREHALAWKIRQSPLVSAIFMAPGNAGTAKLAKNLPLSNLPDIITWLKSGEEHIDLVVVGPDEYLAQGTVDEVEKLGIAVFGPTRAAAQIEWSKAFAKNFMREEGIPTAAYEVFINIDDAKAYLTKQNFPVVIKASGLALGKGVIIAEDLAAGEKALEEILLDKTFGDAGNEVVIEEFMHGREISIHAFCDGEHAILFPAAQDHKRIFENDQGPNTGGMGTIAPVPWVTQDHIAAIREQIVIPTLRALKKRGMPFKGILFPGIMITEQGPKVIEFNARFGDPEVQSYMRILESDIVEIFLACIDGTLSDLQIEWSDNSACCIVCASGGYPGEYKKGLPIGGLEKFEDEADVGILVFHAGTKFEGAANTSVVVTNGGRVLGITAIGPDLQTALANAYQAIEEISFDGMQYREDIGRKSLQ